LAALESNNALNSAWDAIATSLERKHLVVFLDYDGTLTPIINDPEKATMSSHMREVLSSLSQRFDTAIVTGRSREKITAFGSKPEADTI